MREPIRSVDNPSLVESSSFPLFHGLLSAIPEPPHSVISAHKGTGAEVQSRVWQGKSHRAFVDNDFRQGQEQQRDQENDKKMALRPLHPWVVKPKKN